MDELKTHVSSVHEVEKPFKCDMCDYCCSRKSSLKRHIASVHDPLKGHEQFVTATFQSWET